MFTEPIRRTRIDEHGITHYETWVNKETDLPTTELDEDGYWLASNLVAQWYDENPGICYEDEPEYWEEQDSRE